MKDEIEFWLDGRYFMAVDSSHSPLVGDVVSIEGNSYVVSSRNFAIDYPTRRPETKVRLALNIRRQANRPTQRAEGE